MRCNITRAVAVRCTVRCTVIRYGTVRTIFSVFLKIGTVYTVRYNTVYGTVRFFAGPTSLAVQSPAADESKNLQALGLRRCFFILSSFLPESTLWQCLQHHFTFSC